MFELQGFKEFDFSEGMPYVSFTQHGVSFNKAVIKKMGFPEYVKLLINEESKMIAILCSSKDEDKAYNFYNKDNKKNVLSVRWNSKDLLNTISELMNWDLQNSSYKVDGVLYKEDHLMVFDLNTAKTF